LVSAGQVSTAGIVYEKYYVEILWSSQSKEMVLRRGSDYHPTGIPPARPLLEILCTNVTNFRFYEGESAADPPRDPASIARDGRSTYLLGIRVLVGGRSALNGRQIHSILGGKTTGAFSGVGNTAIYLEDKVRLRPESVLNTRSRAVVDDVLSH
jgi:hypothetical protein